MKICITSTGKDLEAPVDTRFGRCVNFIFVNADTLEFKVVQNPNAGATGGAGIQSAQLVANEGAVVVVTGKVGPNAFQALTSLNIKVYGGATGLVKEALHNYKQGTLKKMDKAVAAGKSGKKV